MRCLSTIILLASLMMQACVLNVDDVSYDIDDSESEEPREGYHWDDDSWGGPSCSDTSTYVDPITGLYVVLPIPCDPYYVYKGDPPPDAEMINDEGDWVEKKSPPETITTPSH